MSKRVEEILQELSKTAIKNAQARKEKRADIRRRQERAKNYPSKRK
jgi:hypothetical protein